MDSRSFVCASQHIWRSTHQILIIFCTKLHLDEFKKMFQADFWKKISFAPSGGLPKNPHFRQNLNVRQIFQKRCIRFPTNCSYDLYLGSTLKKISEYHGKNLVLFEKGWFGPDFGHYRLKRSFRWCKTPNKFRSNGWILLIFSTKSQLMLKKMWPFWISTKLSIFAIPARIWS